MKSGWIGLFLCVAMCLAYPISPSYAAHWNISEVWTGKVTITTNGQTTEEDWLPNGSNANRQMYAGSGSTTVTTAGSIKITYTWVNDGPSDTQPAPDQIYVADLGNAYTKSQKIFTNNPPPIINAFGSASATATNGALTVLQDSPGFVYEASYGSGSSTYSKISAGGSFTRTIAVSAMAGADFMGNSGLAEIKAFVGGAVSLHGTPYNFHQIYTNPVVQLDGTLFFEYEFDSTTGDDSDLNTCFGYEIVNYPGGDPFVPPAPFLGTSPPTKNPTVHPIGGNELSDGYWKDSHHPWPIATPYFQKSFTATQKYVYDDSVTGEKEVLMPSPTGVSESSIVRMIGARPAFSGWWYSCSKSGYTSWLEL